MASTKPLNVFDSLSGDITQDSTGNMDSLVTRELPDGSMELVDTAEEENTDTAVEDDYDYDTLLGMNLCDILDDDKISEIAEEVIDGFKDDLESLQDHFEVLKKGVDLLGLKLEEHGDLGAWSCGATHPLIAENAIKLQALAVNELDNPDGPVKTRIFGNNMNPEIEGMATRKQEFMNWFITSKMDSFYPESAKTFLMTSIFGTAFKGNHWDPVFGSIDSSSLRTNQLITHWNTKSLQKSNRYTCILESSDIEIQRKMAQGIFRKINLNEKEGDSVGDIKGGLEDISSDLSDKINEITGVEYTCDRVLLHSYVILDARELLEPSDEDEEFEENEDSEVDEDDEDYYSAVLLPFIVTTEMVSGKVLGIYANWKAGDKNHVPLSYYTDYHLIRGFGFYSLGYVHILGNFQRMLTSIMRSLVDAGTFANLPGGFKLKGSKFAGATEISPGEFVDIESTTQDISKAIMALPFKEPSAVLSSMYQVLEGRGQMFANATEGVVKDSTNYGKVGTTLALLDASSKLTTAIIRDFHRSRRAELKIIERLLKENVKEYPYTIEGVTDRAKAFETDFNSELAEVVPISDPNIPNRAERMSLAQQRVNLAQMFPQVHDTRMALYHIYKTMGDENPDKILPPPQQAKPQDPMSDIQTAVAGNPIAAFPGQAHEAYITVFNNWTGMPEVANNPTMIPAVNAVTAAARTHMIMAYQEKIAALTGQQPTGAGTDPNTLAVLQAQAAQQLAAQAQQMAQMASNAQDPAFLLAQVQQVKAENEKLKIDSKEKIEFARLVIDKERLDLDKQKLATTAAIEDNKTKATLINADEQRKHDKAKVMHSSAVDQSKHALDILGRAAIEDAKNEVNLQKEVSRKSKKDK